MNMYKCSQTAFMCCPDAKFCGPDSVYCSGSWCERFNDSVAAIAASSGPDSLAECIAEMEMEVEE